MLEVPEGFMVTTAQMGHVSCWQTPVTFTTNWELDSWIQGENDSPFAENTWQDRLSDATAAWRSQLAPTAVFNAAVPLIFRIRKESYAISGAQLLRRRDHTLRRNDLSLRLMASWKKHLNICSCVSPSIHIIVMVNFMCPLGLHFWIRFTFQLANLIQVEQIVPYNRVGPHCISWKFS